MRAILLLLTVSFFLLAASSCKRCSECTKYPGETKKLCKKDYATDDSYNMAYRYLQAEGYKCD